jgi:hypothetical protein
MGIDPTVNIIEHMAPADRKKLGRRGETRAETVHRVTTRAERRIHDQFSGFCHRHNIAVWHSSPVKKSSIRTGLPDFLLLKNRRALLIEFKIPPNKLSFEQVEVFAALEENGDHVEVIQETAPGEAYRLATMLARDYFALPEGLE